MKYICRKVSMLIGAVGLLWAITVSAHPIRTWRLVDGSEVSGTFVSKTAEEVAVRMSSGSEVTVRNKDLSTEDFRYLKNIRDAVNEFRTWRLKNLPEGQSRQPGEIRGAVVETRGPAHARSDTYVILIREDYRKKAYPLKHMSEDDRAYVAAMTAGNQKVEDEGDAGEYSKINWAYYDPDRDADIINQHLTEHFRFVWGNDPAAHDGAGVQWFDEDFRKMNYRYWEEAWEFFKDLGAPMPFADAEEKFKYNIYVTSTGLPQHEKGFANSSVHIAMSPLAMRENSTVVPHELQHAIQYHTGGFRNDPHSGRFWESHANWGGHQFAPECAPELGLYANNCHLNLMARHLAYGAWPILQYISEHPKFDPGFCYRIWTESKRREGDIPGEDPIQAIIRIGKNEGRLEVDWRATASRGTL